MRSPHLVVGAGPTGLGCAIELAERSQVELVERTPVAGGESGWRSPEVQALRAEAESRGVRLRLGCVALRWQQTRLLVAAPGRIDWVPGAALFFAGGLRPGTTTDLAITGERPAGVVAATVALHLLEAEPRLWRRAAIIGDGPWAEHVATRIRSGGGQVVLVSGSGQQPAWADRCVHEGRGVEVVGRDRVTAVRVDTGAGVEELACDAVVLAGTPRPNRNVVGALGPDDLGVTFIQPLTGRSVAERSAFGRDAARRWLDENGESL